MSEEIETTDTMPPQRIGFWRVIGEFCASLFGAYLFLCLVEGAIDKLSQNTPWSWEMFRPEKEKFFTMLIMSVGWTLFRIVKNHNKLNRRGNFRRSKASLRHRRRKQGYEKQFN